ncbi:MAG: hypothetical protein GY839_20830 [candidate division Zixibacteria bacterium]|nr:hypothetical protein [candidate division Zixibacteria bacterium]
MADPSKKMTIIGSIGDEEREISINEREPHPDDKFPQEAALTVAVDGKAHRVTFNEDVALTVAVGEQHRGITFKELTLSNNFAIEALVKLLVDQKIIDVNDLQKTMDKVRQERYQMPGQKPSSN